MSWYDNLTRNWTKLNGAYDETFYRMWVYYLLSGTGGFRSRRNQFWQIVFSKGGYPNHHSLGRFLSLKINFTTPALIFLFSNVCLIPGSWITALSSFLRIPCTTLF